ncbi:hypothetical protein B0H14DRAFT_2631892 [Mycena olivaceomarginata]|nr:hypothetical protein B0H14DRAFT_2631892 [Mycena olivaceomarginata]
MIREIADEKYRVRWAKIQEEYNGTDAIVHLQRHALNLPTPFRVLDRIQVVTGIKHRGAIGRIVQVEDEWLRVQCLQESGEQDIIEVEHRRVARHFVEGDFVCVTGASKDRRRDRCGLVVKGERNFDGSDIFDDPLWRAPSRDANFDLNPDSSTSSWAALMPQPDPTVALRSAVGHDLEKHRREGKHDGSDFTDVLRLVLDADVKKQRRLREGRPVGRRFEGVEVLVAWKGPFKGTRGVVVGDFDGPGRAKRMQKCKDKVQDDDGIIVTVQKEGSNAKFTVDIKKLVHVHTRVALSKTYALPNWMLVPWPAPELLALVHRSHRPARQHRPRVLRGRRIAKFSMESSTADGSVFPGLVQKRVDVVLKDIVSSANRNFRPGKRALSCKGRAGYIALDQPFHQEDLDKKMIRVWDVGPNGTGHPVQGPCIRPMRQMADGTPINRVVTRVVIIGPDTEGDVGKLGCYGEARPPQRPSLGRQVPKFGIRFFPFE